METYEIFLLLILGVFILLALYRLVVAIRQNKKGALYFSDVGVANTLNESSTFSHTTKGNDLVLDCPDDMSLSIEGVYINGDTCFSHSKDSDYDVKKAWLALSKAGVGYPDVVKGNKTYEEILNSLKSSYDGKGTVTIKSSDKDLLKLVSEYVKMYPGISACSAKDSDGDIWAPLITIKYSCK